jgi:amino acid adenylation domain-containing protein
MSSLLQELVTAQADRWPENPAVVWRRSALSYGDLETRSNQLARALRDIGCRRGDRVCVSSLRSPEAVVAILAIYKADAIYVPLDVASPPARLAKILRATGPRCVLTCASTAPLIDEVFRLLQPAEAVPVGSLGASSIIGERYSTAFCATDLRQLPARPLPYRNRPANPAQVLFRGGPGGALKGVVLTHATIRRFILWANEHFGVVAGDRHLFQSALSSGLTTYAIVGSLAAGATLHPVSADISQSPSRLADFVRETELTLWLSSAQTIGAMAQLDLVTPNDFPGVRHVVWHGDAPRPSDLRHWMTRLRHTTFTSLYGPTEATVASCYHTVPHRPERERLALPIGRTRPGVGVLVLDDALAPAPPQQIGELHIVGAGLSPGYWRDSDATAAAFVSRTPAGEAGEPMFRTGEYGYVGPDGEIYVAGPRDPMPKSEGPRLELGEIEAAVESLGSVQSAAVVAASDAAGPILCCAYVPVSGLDIMPADLRADLAALLPAHMLPTRWKALNHLPRSADGALEREQIRHWFADESPVLSPVAADTHHGKIRPLA